MRFYKLHFLYITISILTLAAVLTPTQPLHAQDYGWWNNLVQWDGRSHWSEYLIYTPRYFGPNAIPVPEIKDGKIRQRYSAEIGSVAHFSEGDNAQNLTTSLYIPITKNRIGIHLYMVPIEYYQMTSAERDIRFARDFDGRGNAVGDLQISTWIQLTRIEAPVDLLLTINLKTASGSNREATRYTDGAGYSFDISGGRDIYIDGIESYIRPHAQVGLYVWETNEDRNPQNDAFSYGAGVSLNRRSISIDLELGGYIGYKGDGDKPMVTRLKMNKELGEDFRISLGASLGGRDFLYDSYSLSVSKFW